MKKSYFTGLLGILILTALITFPSAVLGQDSLLNGESKVISGQKNEFQHFVLDIPEGQNKVNVEMSGGSGDADLYVKMGRQPSKSNYTCRPYLDGNKEFCSINVTQGNCYISVFGYRAFSDVTIKATYKNGPEPGPANELQNGQSATVSAETDGWKYYTINVPENIYELNISTTGGTGNANIYIQYEDRPNFSYYIRKSIGSNNEEYARIKNHPTYGTAKPIKAGTYYIGVYGKSAFSGLSLTPSY